MSFQETWDRGWLALGADILKDHKDDLEGLLKMIATKESARGTWTEIYRILVRQRKCDRIESMDKEEKLILWNDAKELTGSQDKQILVNTCKAIAALLAFTRQ